MLLHHVVVHIVSTVILLFFPIASFSEMPNASKQQQWENLENEVETWIDGMGKRIDPKIKNTTIALNILGFHTDQSCEGHLNWGNSYPWVDFSLNSEDIELLFNQAGAISEARDAEEKRLIEKYSSFRDVYASEESAELKKLSSQYHQMIRTIKQRAQSKLTRLQFLIEQFYENHHVPYDRMLILIPIDSQLLNYRLQSLGALWADSRTEEEKAEKLKEYQKEMSLFTNFLTECFYTDFH